jgi:hypothetical protein
MRSPLDGTWLLHSGQPLPEGVRDMKIISDGHFMFAAYDQRTGRPLYSAGGSCELIAGCYTEHMDFASGKLAALVGKDQSFSVTVDGDTLTQDGTLTNGQPLSEIWTRLT